MTSIPPQRRFLEGHAKWRPDDVAVRFADTGEALTFGEFDDRANRLANALHDRGIRYGDRVGMLLFNTHEFPVTLYACHKLGAIPVAVNTQLSVDDFAYIMDNMNAQALVYDETIREAVERAEAAATRGHDLIGAGFEPDGGEAYDDVLDSGSPETPSPIDRDKDEISYMFYTSGTTGRPKGVMHSVKSGRERANVSIIECGIDTESVSLALLPWYHGAGIDITIRATVSAGAQIIVLKEPDVETSLDVIEEFSVTHIMSVPTLTSRFADVGDIGERDLSSVDYWMHTGEVLTEKQVHRFQDTLSENVYNLYGSSESGVDTVLRPRDLPEKAGTVGRPAIGVEARVVKPESRGLADPEKEVPVGEQGELILRTDQMFPGYYENDDATREVLSDGWFYTNDLAVIDEDGYLTVTGRADDMIISGGELISPVEVEETLESHRKVRDAVAVGVEDEEWGQRVKAYVAGSADLTAEELDAFAKDADALADYKRPKEYEFVGEISRTGAGKKERAKYREED